jgi:hypothetical protein
MAITPVTVGTSGYVGQGVYGVSHSTVSPAAESTSGNNLLTVGKLYPNKDGLKLSIFYFAGDVSDGETWTSEIKNAVACAWQGADADDDAGCAFIPAVSKAGSRGRGGAVFTFAMQNASSEGWLWVLHGS